MDAVPQAVPPQASTVSVGKCMTGFGVMGCLRIVPEVLEVHSYAMRIYFVITGLDVMLGALTIAAGVGLWRGKSWARWAAVGVAGMALPNSIGLGVWLFPEVWNALRGYLSVENAILLPRLLFYVVTVAFWPWAAWTIIRSVPPRSRKPLWAAFGGTFGVASVLVGIFFISRP